MDLLIGGFMAQEFCGRPLESVHSSVRWGRPTASPPPNHLVIPTHAPLHLAASDWLKAAHSAQHLPNFLQTLELAICVYINDKPNVHFLREFQGEMTLVQ